MALPEDTEMMDAASVAAHDQLEAEITEGAKIAGLLYRKLKAEGVPRKLRMGLTAAWFHGWLESDDGEDDDE
jgi:hypothetical protein